MKVCVCVFMCQLPRLEGGYTKIDTQPFAFFHEEQPDLLFDGFHGSQKEPAWMHWPPISRITPFLGRAFPMFTYAPLWTSLDKNAHTTRAKRQKAKTKYNLGPPVERSE